MKKIDLGQTISILANIGVIAGIVFLGYELRQNTDLLENQANAIYINNRLALNTHLYADNEFAEIFYKARNGEELTGLEQFKLDNYYSTTLIELEWEYLQYRRGYHTDLPVASWKKSLNEWPGMRQRWYRVTTMDPEFMKFMNEEVFEP